MPAERALAEISASAEYALGVANSFSGRPWHFRSSDEDLVRALELSGLSPVLARLLAAREIVPSEAARFLEPRLKSLLPDPLVLANMDHAAERFASALTGGESIAVLGDYDVDGACASALLLRYLRQLGRDGLLHIPDRMTEGYGPSVGAMKSLRARGATLVVTVDCGAGAHEALAFARDQGLDVIVLDHHATERNPPAFAHVNPNGPDDDSELKYLSAAGVAFLMLVAVQRMLRVSGWFDAKGIVPPDLLEEIDIVALATVTDVVPLLGVNRAFVRQGLRKLEALERPGIAALAKVAGVSPPFTTHHLGFVFGPRINAGGRVGRCDLGARLLVSRDATEAEALATELDRHNRERQAIEGTILEAAEALARAQADKSFVLLARDGWHPGVVGIVASRLKDRYAKPVLVAGFADSRPDCIARGSARSVTGVDLGTVIRAARRAGLIETGGGHAMAAGFSLRREQIAPLAAFLEQEISPRRAAMSEGRRLIADSLVSASAAIPALLDELDRAGPYGAGHPEPLFVMADMTVTYADVVGSNHVRLRLVGREGQGIDAVAFRVADAPLGLGLLKSRGKTVHVAGRLKRDDYGGTPRVQLHIEDAVAAGA
jgi:single-stranded-DNA-specific exonuclease